jgi:hypothetical protein
MADILPINESFGPRATVAYQAFPSVATVFWLRGHLGPAKASNVPNDSGRQWLPDIS